MRERRAAAIATPDFAPLHPGYSLTSHGSDLGQFTLSYLGETNQIMQRQLAGSTLATTWNYLPNSGDRRLAGIANAGLSAGQYTDFQFTSTPEDFITAIAETSDAAPAYPSPGTQTASYNDLNQLTNLSGQALTWDADGNLLSDGQRTYSWDAENRLIGITYPGQPGKQTAFAYDGLGRRTTITSTPAGGGSAVTTSYVWCGTRPCQARDASNAVTREYFAEGEFVPGPPSQPYYYGIDQIGSVRRVFASSSNAPAYSYDPYGVPLQDTAQLTDFGYAGMFHNADSGLDLTLFRAYDPVVGRWLSRDPLGESSDPIGNLYPYADSNPISYIDPAGSQAVAAIIAGAVIGGAYGAAAELVGQLASTASSTCPPGPLNINAILIGAVGGAIGGAVGGALAATGPIEELFVEASVSGWIAIAGSGLTSVATSRSATEK